MKRARLGPTIRMTKDGASVLPHLLKGVRVLAEEPEAAAAKLAALGALVRDDVNASIGRA
jgi:hypothetical protein